MIQKTEELQSVIEQEASAHSYYYNYPPKNEQQEGASSKKADTEQQKLKRIFDEQMAAVERKWERRYADFAESVSAQMDDLSTMLSDSLKDVIYWKNMFVNLDIKFKEYVTKSERYIKDKDTKLAEVQEEVQQMSYKYKNHGKIYDEEKQRAD